MLTALAMPGESRLQSAGSRSAVFGVAQRWPFQQSAVIDGISIAVDADLVNLKELAAHPKLQKDSARSMPLAELLVRLYMIDGPSFVEKMHGAFAIAIWDEREQRLVAAIDRLGIRGLYWSQQGDRFLFASHARAVLAAQTYPSDVNHAAIMQFLLFSVVPAPLTSYRGLQKLSPGHLLLYERGQVRQKCYWDVAYDESEDHDEKRWATEVRESMRAAVHRHCEGLQPQTSGAYLSGGTDSSSVTAFMSEVLSPVRTFSIAFSESRYDEVNFARTTAERFHTQHNELRLSPADASTAIQKITDYYDEPFANSSSIGSYLCAKLARDNGVETLLAGDGGDELFAGNSRYAEDRRFQIYHRIPMWLRRRLIEPVVSLLPQNDGKMGMPWRYVRRANIPNPQRIFSYGLFQSLSPQEVFSADFLAEVPPQSWMGIIDSHFHRVRASSELNRLMYMDLKLILADNDIRKVSGTAEIAGVNVRYPLLDDSLVELSSRIPSGLKLKGSEKRYIFKKAMQDILPKIVLHKKKHGFGVPLALWLLQDPDLRLLMDDVLRDAKTRQRGYFRPEFLDQLTNLHRNDHAAYYGEVVWYLVALELWHRRHVDRSREPVGAR